MCYLRVVPVAAFFATNEIQSEYFKWNGTDDLPNHESITGVSGSQANELTPEITWEASEQKISRLIANHVISQGAAHLPDLTLT
jgi:hypothetical protein